MAVFWGLRLPAFVGFLRVKVAGSLTLPSVPRLFTVRPHLGRSPQDPGSQESGFRS